ncbi:MAG: ASKHA domain-containing protein [Desulfobacterales bacterium]
MTCLTILPLGKKIEVKPGTILLDAIRQAGIEISSPCNGRQLCGKCKVGITGSAPPVDAPHEHLKALEVAAGTRLACQVVIQSAMQVTLPEDYSMDTRILEGELIEKGRIAPAVQIRETTGQFQLCYRNLPPVPMDTWHLAFSPKGIAVDLGTTTLVVTLLDLQAGTELATASAVNPQTRFGHDVMTRIHKASTKEGLAELAKLIANGLNALVEKTCRASGTHPHEIVDAVIGGNTTMLQIAAAIDPSPLGVVPFTVGIQSGQTYPADQFRLDLNPQARVYIPPVTHAFVGSDVSAGLLSIDFFKQRTPTLFIDMGTNGEMALIANGHSIVTSTAAGPAFEGMGITHGMRASSGAIEMVWSNGKYLNLRTIDDAPARGICGSGIMDIMACLIQLGAVEPSGRLRNPHKDNIELGPLSERYEIVNQIVAFKLTDNVYFTQKDIRQFQLAKSAIQTGVEMLLAAAGLDSDQLEKIVIAGAFGYHLRKGSLRQIGIVPRNFKGEIDFAGNTCRTGCALMLADATTRDLLQEKMKQVTHLAIAEAPDFQSRFIKNISLNGLI